jgi:hypothetical protein
MISEDSLDMQDRHYLVRVLTTTAQPVLVAPAQGDLQRGMQVGEAGVAADQQPAGAWQTGGIAPRACPQWVAIVAGLLPGRACAMTTGGRLRCWVTMRRPRFVLPA